MPPAPDSRDDLRWERLLGEPILSALTRDHDLAGGLRGALATPPKTAGITAGANSVAAVARVSRRGVTLFSPPGLTCSSDAVAVLL